MDKRTRRHLQVRMASADGNEMQNLGGKEAYKTSASTEQSQVDYGAIGNYLKAIAVQFISISVTLKALDICLI